MITIYGINTCNTTKKALHQFPKANFFNYKHQTLSKEKLTSMYKISNLPINKWINTSGKSYKQIDKMLRSQLTTEQWLDLMAKDNLLIKRPIIETQSNIYVGNNYPTEE